MKKHTSYMLFNALIQLSVIFAYMNLALVWPLYITIVLLSILIAVQTISAGAFFSGNVKEKATTTEADRMSFVVVLAYFLSCYVLYIAGFQVFSIVAATHVTISLFSITFGALSK